VPIACRSLIQSDSAGWLWIEPALRARLTSPLPDGERSDRIARCDPGEGLAILSLGRNPSPARSLCPDGVKRRSGCADLSLWERCTRCHCLCASI